MQTVMLSLTPWTRRTIVAGHGRVDTLALRKTLRVKTRLDFTIVDESLPDLDGKVISLPDLVIVAGEEVEASVYDDQRLFATVVVRPDKVVVR